MRLVVALAVSVSAAACGPSSHATGPAADPCDGVTCATPPDAFCNLEVMTAFEANGTCDGSSGAPVCSYTMHTTDCAAQGMVCFEAACFDACQGSTCAQPPPDLCSGDTLVTYDQSGTCDGSSGSPVCTYTSHQTDCTQTNQVCRDGGCIDPCDGVTCDAPPPAACANSVVQTFAATGTCAATGGTPSCSYAETDHDCALTGQTCAAGACTGTFEFCRIQFPASVIDVPGTTAAVYGRIYVQGITDRSGVDDPDPSVVVELGVGSGSDPTAYTYTAATPNASYGPGSPGYEANNDEYQASVTVTGAAGTALGYAYRLSDDGGASWIYCDVGDAGSSDGFTMPGALDSAAPYFSEYVEGTAGSNKAISIHNPTSVAFALTGCQIQVFANGNTTSTNTVLTGSAIAPGGVYTLCKTGIADATHCDQSSGSGLWNGNDAIALACGGTVLDVIGQIGNDPGAPGWGSGDVTTTDHTLLRACTVFSGDTDGSDAFDPSVQWRGYPADTLTYLGARNCPLP